MTKKSLIFSVIIILVTTNAFAQDRIFKPIKVDGFMGFAIPTSGGSNAKGGVIFGWEPHYRVNDAISAGLRMEGAALGHSSGTGSSSSVTIAVTTSYCATGEYYFSNNNFRPFAGAGLGIFRTGSYSASSSGTSTTVAGQSNFGFFPRVGFEVGHFRMSGEYNIVKDAGYLGFKLGFFVGGGRYSSSK